jgi:uncharacterized protein YigE (DUF2233 family)
MLSRVFLGLLLYCLFWSSAVAACRIDGDYSVCEFDPSKTRLETFSLDENGAPLGTFSALETMLNQQGLQLGFAMNAGMFDASLRPVGLYIEDGIQAKRLNRRNGSGNFHLKPNGVFYLDAGRAAVVETERFAKLKIKPEFATQSGPMLVIDGNIHPKFSSTGVSQKIRNGVGVRDDGTVVFVISNATVNFFDFASLFRDRLDCPNALFLDGSVSSLYAPELGRTYGLVPLGPMVGAIKVK